MRDNNMAIFFDVLRRAVARPRARIEVLESVLRILRATSPFSEATNEWLDGALECAADGYQPGVDAALEMAYLFAREEMEQEVTR